MGLFTKRLWPASKKKSQTTQRNNSIANYNSPTRQISKDNPLYSPNNSANNSPDKLYSMSGDRLNSVGSTKDDRINFNYVKQQNYDDGKMFKPDEIFSENMDFKNLDDFNLQISKTASDKVLTFFNKSKDKIKELTNDITRLTGILDNYHAELNKALIKRDEHHNSYSELDNQEHENKHIKELKEIVRSLEVNIDNLKEKKHQVEENVKNKGKAIKSAFKFKELLDKEEKERKKKNRWKIWKKGGGSRHRRGCSRKTKSGQCRRTRRQRRR